MLKELNIKYFDEIYEILFSSFPTDEIRPYQEQRELFKNTKFKVLSLADDDGKIKAFITVYILDTMIFAEHFAVREEYRNRGLGSILLKELLNMTDKMICLEAEPPDTDIAKRRIEFYKRNGFFLNDHSYIQPPLSKGQGSVKLKLMTTKKPLTPTEFDKVSTAIYEQIYHIS